MSPRVLPRPPSALPLTLLLVAVGCGAPDAPADKGGGDTAPVDSGGADGGGAVEPVYPTGDRILLWWGASGFEPASAGKGHFSGFDAHVKAETGWNTDHRDTWTEDLSPYRLIGLVAPGHTGGAGPAAAELEALRGASAAGARLLLMADEESCDNAAFNGVLEALGSSIRLTGEASDANLVVAPGADDLATGHQTMAGVSALRFKSPCWLRGGSVLALASAGQTVAAVERLDTGGDVVVLGDLQALDDSGQLDAEGFDNPTFAVNLAKVDPAL